VHNKFHSNYVSAKAKLIVKDTCLAMPLDDWPAPMYRPINTRKDGQGGRRNYVPSHASKVFLLLLSWLAMNL
jgi:hypothetical protein